MLFPYAPAYREAVYRKIDATWPDVEWYFCGNAERPLKLLDYGVLRRVDLSLRERRVVGPVMRYEIPDMERLMACDAIIFPATIRNLTFWRMLHCMRRRPGRRPRLIAWTHGWYGRESRLQAALKRLFWRNVDDFLLYGDYARRLMTAEGFRPERLHVIANSLDYDRQLELRRSLVPSDIYRRMFGNDRPVVVFIGRLTYEKRLDMLLRAMTLLAGRGLKLNLLLVGAGEAGDMLRAEVRAAGLDDCVRFYGPCYDEAANAELLYNADLCVSPGNVGLTAIHAMMFGCPVLTHDNFKYQGPEFEAVKPGVTGAFFRQGATDSLALCMEEWLAAHGADRTAVRRDCYAEIDGKWNPYYQIEVLKSVLCDAGRSENS